MHQYVIRARYNDKTIRVYQAFSPAIAKPALAAQKFVPPFQMERMTWIKPSFNWMMYRCGYATKAGQEVVLGIDITRAGFEWALEHAAHSRYIPSLHASHNEWKKTLEQCPVRIQWDPERDFRLNIVDGVRAIQVGLASEAVRRYVDEWIVSIEDVTDVVRRVAELARVNANYETLPDRMELPYPLSENLRARICHE